MVRPSIRNRAVAAAGHHGYDPLTHDESRKRRCSSPHVRADHPGNAQRADPRSPARADHVRRPRTGVADAVGAGAVRAVPGGSHVGPRGDPGPAVARRHRTSRQPVVRRRAPARRPRRRSATTARSSSASCSRPAGSLELPIIELAARPRHRPPIAPRSKPSPTSSIRAWSSPSSAASTANSTR